MATYNTPKHINYTTTANFADAITVNDIHTAFLAVNQTGEDVDITFDGANDTRYFVLAGAALLVDVGFKFKANIRAKSTSGSGAAGLHLTVW